LIVLQDLAPPTPATPQTAPVIAGVPTPFQVIVRQFDNVAQNPAEYRALMDKRDELTSQLMQEESRRATLTAQSQRGGGAQLQSQLKSVNARVERLQAEVDRTNDLIANTSASVLAAARAENRSSSAAMPPDVAARLARDLVPLAGMFTVFFLFPIAIALARLLWKRASGGGPPRQGALPDAASTQRLDQLQQSVDAIALEVERISEGQRYVAKVFAERDKERPAIGA
jgi:cell division protein FtsB